MENVEKKIVIKRARLNGGCLFHSTINIISYFAKHLRRAKINYFIKNCFDKRLSRRDDDDDDDENGRKDERRRRAR